MFRWLTPQLFLHILCEGVCFCRDTPEHSPVKSSVYGKLCTLSCPYLSALEMHRVPSFVSIKWEVQKMDAEVIEGEIRGAYILYIHHRSAFSVFHHIMSPCSLKICWLTALHASLLHLVFSLPPSLPVYRSLSSVARSSPPSPWLLYFFPPSPSFWRVGSSELVAVCIAKGNVSSTHRKMGQNIRTLTAHAQWHTA